MGMGNLIKYIRYEISHVAPDLSEADAKVKIPFLLLDKLPLFQSLLAQKSLDQQIPC